MAYAAGEWAPRLAAGIALLGAVALVAVGNLDSSIRPGELAHETRSNKALQSSLAHSMMGNGNVDSKKAKAIAAAAAEIAKVLKVPSARDLVLGKKGAEMSYGPSPRQVQKEVHSKKHKLAGWLKTPSSEGEFKYHHTAVHVKNGCPKCHNQMDLASAVHGWSDTPDRSVMGAQAYASAE